MGNYLFVTGSFDKTLKIWEISSLDGETHVSQTLEGHKVSIMDVSISNEDKYIISADQGGSIKVWKKVKDHPSPKFIYQET